MPNQKQRSQFAQAAAVIGAVGLAAAATSVRAQDSTDSSLWVHRVDQINLQEKVEFSCRIDLSEATMIKPDTLSVNYWEQGDKTKVTMHTPLQILSSEFFGTRTGSYNGSTILTTQHAQAELYGEERKEARSTLNSIHNDMVEGCQIAIDDAESHNLKPGSQYKDSKGFMEVTRGRPQQILKGPSFK